MIILRIITMLIVYILDTIVSAICFMSDAVNGGYFITDPNAPRYFLISRNLEARWFR